MGAGKSSWLFLLADNFFDICVGLNRFGDFGQARWSHWLHARQSRDRVCGVTFGGVFGKCRDEMMRTSASRRQAPKVSGERSGRSTAMFMAMLFFHTLGMSFSTDAANDVRPSYSAAKALREDSTLRAVAFRDASFGVAVGDRGTILKTENGGLTWSHTESHVDCELSDVVWVNKLRVVAVGGGYDTITRLSRGAVVVSDDAGKTWRRVTDQELSRMHRVSFDSDRRLTIAAGDWSSVSMSVHHTSRDGGSTWNVDDELFDTATEIREPSPTELRQWVASINASAPVRGACHPSEQLYWAVGDHGCIYHSHDGGNRWTTQRGEGRRTAVLVVASNAESLPWSLVGNECLELGNRVSVLLLDPRSLARANATEPRGIDLARQAAISLGASGVDVSLPSEASQIIAAHRPSVLVMDNSLSPSVREALSQSAIELAVQRIAVVSQDGGGGETRLHRSAMLPHSGVLAGDFSQDALNLVVPGVTASGSLSLRRTYDAVGASLRGESVTSGMALPRSNRLEGERPQATRRQLQIIQARLSEPKRIEQVISTGANETNLASGINSLIDQSSSDDRLRVAFDVYCNAVRTGNSALQRVILKAIASHDEFGSAAALAQLRFDAMESSQEWKKLEQNSFASPGLVAVDSNRDSLFNVAATPETVAISPFQSQGVQLAEMPFDSSRVVTASATSPIVVPDTTPEIATPIATTSIRDLHLPQGRVANTKQVARVDLNWEFHPMVLIARDTFRRQSSVDQLQSVVEINGNLERLSQSNLATQWSRLAKPNIPTDSLVARLTTIPPRLDGALTDDCWNSPGVAVNQVELRLAYDRQFLYVAVQAPSEQLRHVTLPVGTTISIRDNDLTPVDRLAISLDVDRDLMTAFRLETTVNQHTSDTVDGQKQWQPTWYVATSNPQNTTNNAPTVVFETAILLSDLVASPLTPGESWLCEVKCLSAGATSTFGTMSDPSGWIRFVFE